MSARPPIEAVIFDWGGTLTPWHVIDPLDPWRAYAAVVAPDDPDDPGSCERLAQRLHLAEDARWIRQRTTAGAEGTGRLDEVFLESGVDIGTALHGAGLASYLAWWDPHTIADPDAIGLMEALRERGIRVGVLSNTLWPRWHHEAVFERDGLQELIDGAVYTSELPVGKPHVESFLAALASVHVADPARAVFVGDRPYEDVQGAHDAGMRAILLPHPHLRPDELVPVSVGADAVVARLGEVLDVVVSWGERLPS